MAAVVADGAEMRAAPSKTPPVRRNQLWCCRVRPGNVSMIDRTAAADKTSRHPGPLAALPAPNARSAGMVSPHERRAPPRQR